MFTICPFLKCMIQYMNLSNAMLAKYKIKLTPILHMLNLKVTITNEVVTLSYYNFIVVIIIIGASTTTSEDMLKKK